MENLQRKRAAQLENDLVIDLEISDAVDEQAERLGSSESVPLESVTALTSAVVFSLTNTWAEE